MVMGLGMTMGRADDPPAPAGDAHVPPEVLPAQSPGALGLTDLEALALRNNPTLAQALATVDHSRAMALQAGLYPNPTVGYVGDQIGVEGTAGEMQGAFLQQRIVTAGKLKLSRAKYNQAAVEAEIRAQAQRLRVVNGVHLAYFELLADQALLETRRELVRNAEEALRTRREMMNTGQAGEMDVLLQEADLARARLAVAAAENQYGAHWRRLAALVGCPDLPPAPLLNVLDQETVPLLWEPALAQLLQDSPEMQLARAHIVFDQITLHRERVQKIPDLQLQASVGRNFETSNTVAGAMVGVQLPIFDWNQGTVRQVQADLARSQAELTRVELMLRQRLADAFTGYLTAWKAVSLYRETTLPTTRRAYEVSLDMYQKRRLGWPQVVEMEQRLLRTKAEYTASLLELRMAEVTIRGLLLVDGLERPPGPTPGGHLESTPKPR
jgi:cobalt-zinc-cadmium efflux system outer membrane protein